MSLLKTAIAAGRWDLAAHTLVYAVVVSLQKAKEEPNAQKLEQEANTPKSR